MISDIYELLHFGLNRLCPSLTVRHAATTVAPLAARASPHSLRPLLLGLCHLGPPLCTAQKIPLPSPLIHTS